MASQGGSWLGLRVAAKVAAATCVTVALLLPANAQFWGNWGPQRPQRAPQGYNPFGGWFGVPPPQREAPADYSRAPASQRKADAAAAVPVLVVGDAMADWLAYGLEEALVEKPEFAIVRKHRTYSGLVRYDSRRDSAEWPQVAKELIAAEKPKFIVMMIGVHDRQAIRERTQQQTRQKAAAGKQAPAARPAPPPDPELQAQQSADQQNAELREQQQPAEQPEQAPTVPPEAGRGAAAGNTGPAEFRTEQWEAAYIKRIDATVASLKSAGVPVFWVGLPPQRASRASTDSSYLNELFRQRAEKAGITYVDVWDGFVDTAGQFTAQGPDVDGQIRRLRSGDGIYFTKAGARKLAHYVEREIQRTITNRGVVPVALPTVEPTPAPTQPGARPGGPAQRPLVGPVVPLTTVGTGQNELLGGGPARPPAADPVATRVLVRGEPVPVASGRADDFSWPRSSTAIVEPPPVTLTEPPAPGKGQPSQSNPAYAGKSGEPKQPVQKRQGTPQRPPTGTRPQAFGPPSFWWR